MLISRENKKLEAIKRLNLLGIYPETITQFDNENLLSISMPPVGAFFRVDSETEERVRQFEAEYNALVYVVVRSYTTIGRMDSYFYVSD